jgi:iron complex outermembrane receptor protein
VVQNVGKGRFYGGEFEATALIQKIILNASIGVTDPKFTEGPNVGPPVTNVSRQTAAVNMSYPIQFQAGKLTVSMDYNWRSREYFFEPISGNAGQSAAVSQASFGLFDAVAKFDFASTRLSISLWGRNWMDKQYKARVTDFITGGLPYDAYIPGTPRTFGATLNYGF